MTPQIREKRPCRRGLAGCIAGLVVMTIVLHAPVANAQSTSDDVPNFVTPPENPTEVSIGAYLIGLSQVSEPSAPFPTFEVEMFVNLAWKDPRLAFGDDGSPPHVFLGEEAEEKLTEIWSPDIEIQNEVEQRTTESVELTIRPDGSVDYEERFGAELNAELDLREFPFDRQTMDMVIQSFVWDRTEVRLTPNEGQTGFDPDFETPEWSVFSVEADTDVRTEVRDDREFSSYIFSIHAKRYAGHYLLRLLLPLFFVMTLTYLVFWQPIEDRFRVGFIALLTVVATHTVVSSNLPRLNYPTFVDAVLIICYLAATTLTIVSIVVQKTEERGNPERAKRVDRWARWILPVVALLFLAVYALMIWS